MTYYTSLILITLLSLAVLSVLVSENGRLSRNDKRIMYLTYIVVALAALSEWLGVKFNGDPNVPVWLIRLVKYFDYLLTPVSGGIIVFQFHRIRFFKKTILSILFLNFLFQTVSLFTGWMLTVNENHEYSHGPLYPVYMIIYILIVINTILSFSMHGRKFRKQNRLSLYAVLVLVSTGILLQEILDVRTAYFAMAMGFCLLFIHNTEFSQLAADDTIHDQMIQISVDPLTGALSRHAYEKVIHETETLPPDFVVFSIDINGLKHINDSLGHAAGDELICGASDCITSVFNSVGTCYRTGGDEFIVFAETKSKLIPVLMENLKTAAAGWKGKVVPSLSVSAGFAAAKDHPGVSLEKLISIADSEMYEEKEKFYQSAGIRRRIL